MQNSVVYSISKIARTLPKTWRLNEYLAIVCPGARFYQEMSATRRTSFEETRDNLQAKRIHPKRMKSYHRGDGTWKATSSLMEHNQVPSRAEQLPKVLRCKDIVTLKGCFPCVQNLQGQSLCAWTRKLRNLISAHLNFPAILPLHWTDFQTLQFCFCKHRRSWIAVYSSRGWLSKNVFSECMDVSCFEKRVEINDSDKVRMAHHKDPNTLHTPNNNEHTTAIQKKQREQWRHGKIGTTVTITLVKCETKKNKNESNPELIKSVNG